MELAYFLIKETVAFMFYISYIVITELLAFYVINCDDCSKVRLVNSEREGGGGGEFVAAQRMHWLCLFRFFV